MASIDEIATRTCKIFCRDKVTCSQLNSLLDIQDCVFLVSKPDELHNYEHVTLICIGYVIISIFKETIGVISPKIYKILEDKIFLDVFISVICFSENYSKEHWTKEGISLKWAFSMELLY